MEAGKTGLLSGQANRLRGQVTVNLGICRGSQPTASANQLTKAVILKQLPPLFLINRGSQFNMTASFNVL